MGINIFVAGGAGVIGQQLVPKLIRDGHKVTVGDVKPKPHSFNSSVKYMQLDLVNLTQNALNDTNSDLLINLAATFERSTESIEFFEDSFHNNNLLSHHLLTLTSQSKTIKRVLFTSSYLVYDSGQYLFKEPAKEPVVLGRGSEIRPRNLIGMAKLSHEAELNHFVQFPDTKFSVVIARIYRGYGLGSRDVISRWVRALLRDEEIEIFRPEGMFDFIYSKDSAEGIARLALDTSICGTIDLGTGRSRRVSEILEVLNTYFPKMASRFVESDLLYEGSQANTSELLEKLNWTPEYTLEKAIPEIVAFEKNALTE